MPGCLQRHHMAAFPAAEVTHVLRRKTLLLLCRILTTASCDLYFLFGGLGVLDYLSTLCRPGSDPYLPFGCREMYPHPVFSLGGVHSFFCPLNLRHLAALHPRYWVRIIGITDSLPGVLLSKVSCFSVRDRRCLFHRGVVFICNAVAFSVTASILLPFRRLLYSKRVAMHHGVPC